MSDSNSNAVAIITFSEMEKLANSIAASGLFGLKTKDQAFALMAIAQAEGMHPASAAMEYNIIQGKPARTAESILTRFQKAGGKVEWLEYNDERVCGTFSHPQGGKVTIDWDMARAAKAGLSNKDNWKKWPRNMLRARVISEACRTVFPGATNNFQTPDEVEEFEDIPSSQNSSQSSRAISNKNGTAQLPSMPPQIEQEVIEHEKTIEMPFGESNEDKKMIFEMALEIAGTYDIDQRKNDSLIKTICRTVLTKNPTKETIGKDITQLFYEVKKHRPQEINL